MLAILLWSYVVSSNPSITRTKDINGLTAYLSNESTLNANRLALASDPAEALDGISVRLEVPQSSYALADADNVQVTLDLSSVRAAGTQEVPLRATTSYGRVTRILPESVKLEFETYDSRSVPVNAAISGEQQEDIWYNINRLNPEELVISGPSSVVQTVASAYVYVDVTGRETSYVTAARFVLLDYSGEEIPQTLLSSSSSSITVGVDVYPTRELPISTAIEDVVQGTPAEGYEVTSVSIQPESVTVAADAQLLDSLTELLIQPVDVSGASQTFSQRTRIVALNDFKDISTEQVYVTVNIEEVQKSAWADVELTFINYPDDLTCTFTDADFRVLVTGPASRVDALAESGVEAIGGPKRPRRRRIHAAHHRGYGALPRHDAGIRAGQRRTCAWTPRPAWNDESTEATMAANSFADTVVNGMLSWLKGFANWVLRLFDLAGSGGVSPLEWLSDHWLQLLIILLIVGVAADIIVWLIRWRPYWVWFRKKRIVVDDKEFFEDAEANGPRATRPSPCAPCAGRTPSCGARTRAPCPVRPQIARAAFAAAPGAANKRRTRRGADVFEDEMFKIKPAPQARKVPEDAVFNVSNLPGAQKEKKRPAPKKRVERKEDDLFDIH